MELVPLNRPSVATPKWIEHVESWEKNHHLCHPEKNMKYVSIILGVTQITIPLNHHVLQVYKQNSLNNFECVLLKKAKKYQKKNANIWNLGLI